MASGGKGGTQTTTQKTELPQYVQDAQQNLINQGQTMTGPFTQTPGYAKAGFNADQLMAFDLARGMAQDAFTPAQSSGMSFLDGVTASPSLLTGAAQAGLLPRPALNRLASNSRRATRRSWVQTSSSPS